MKRCIALLLCAALAALPGCVYANSQPEGAPYALYFREADLRAAQGGDALRAETAYLGEFEFSQTAEAANALMTELLKGPLDETLKSPIPPGTTLLSLELKGSQAVVDLSPSYSSLSGVGLTMADYCIALTLTQLPGIRSVRITVRGQELAYRNSQTFFPADVLLSTTEDVVAAVEVSLFFLDEAGNLVQEDRALDLYEGDTQVGAVLEALREGPSSRELSSALPEGFQIQAAWMEKETCYVNLSSAALPDLPEGAPIQTALLALSRSLCSLDMVSEVQFLVDGEFTAAYGSVPVAAPFVG